jgi:hypothetical protein
VKELDPWVKQLNARMRAIDEAERSAGDARYQEKKRADEKRRAEADAQAADDVAERRFDDAALVFEVAASGVSTNEVKQALVDRAERLRAAAKAIERVLDYVVLKRDASGIVYSFNGKVLKAYDAKKQPPPGSIRFHETNADENEPVRKIARDDLHQWSRKAALDDKAADALLDAAALAYEVGCAHEAVRKDLADAEARGLKDTARAEKYRALLR